MACQPSALLDGATRREEPLRKDYALYNPELDEDDAEYNEGISSLYWTNLLIYEREKLYSLFFVRDRASGTCIACRISRRRTEKEL